MAIHPPGLTASEGARVPAPSPRAVARSDRARAGRLSLTQLLMPPGLVACVLALAIGVHLGAYGGNLTGFIQFGSVFAKATHPPPGALINSPQGYDGQFFYVQALDPLLLHQSTVNALRAAGESFRLQRVGYPALAAALAIGHASAVPLMLLAINVAILLLTALAFAAYARRRGWSTLWAVPIALTPGMLLPALRDLSDPLATASGLAAVLLWRSGRRWPAAAALTVAVLTREVMMLAVVALAAEAGVRAWRSRTTPTAWRGIVAGAAPVVLVPSLAFAGWQAYLAVRYGGLIGGAPLSVPIFNLVREVRGSFASYPPAGVWDLGYALLILAASWAALRSLRAGVTVVNACACALALGVLVPTLGDIWSDARLSAPLFALVLVDGLQRKDRRSVLIGTAAAAMTVLLPIAIPGSL